MSAPVRPAPQKSRAALREAPAAAIVTASAGTSEHLHLVECSRARVGGRVEAAGQAHQVFFTNAAPQS